MGTGVNQALSKEQQKNVIWFGLGITQTLNMKGEKCSMNICQNQKKGAEMRIGVFEILPIKEKDFDFEVRLHYSSGAYLPAKICNGDLETALQTIFITGPNRTI